jgi:hypothetical protein
VVHSSERRQAANLLQALFEGKITNDEYDNDYPNRSGDPGLDVVYDRIWLHYSDLHTHLFDREELTSEQRELFVRCIAFLRTDLEYEGPLLGLGLPVWQRIARLFGLNVGSKGHGKGGSEFLDPYWPFATENQYQQARRAMSS